MLYKIGDVANLIGITPEAIRNYEREGLIKPQKDENSGYRYFSSWDMHILINTRQYRQFYYSIADIYKIFSEDEYEILDIVKKQEDIIQDIIFQNMILLKYIRKSKQVFREALDYIDKFKIVQSPGVYRIDMQNGYNLLPDKDIIKIARSWIENPPFYYSSALFREEDIKNKLDRFSFGLCIEKEYFDLLNMKNNENIRYIESKYCLYTVFLSSTDEVLGLNKLKPAFNYMKTKGLKHKGDIFTRVLFTKKVENKYITYHETFIPIEI